VNTDKVQPLSTTATKPASTGSTQTVKRTTASPTVEQALILKRAAVSDSRSVQEVTAAAAAQIESYLRSNGRSLHFSVDTQSGMTVVSVKDIATGDVIRQIPSEEALRLAHALQTQGGSSSLLDVEA
jgi:flagellar protein FlaG